MIVVSGLPRSGTSLMMNMLQAGGVPIVTDEQRTADDDNPKGYFELERVKQLSKGDVAWVSGAHGKAVKVISALLEHLPPTSSYKILFMRRRLPEVLASQRKMLERRGEPTDTVPDARWPRCSRSTWRRSKGGWPPRRTCPCCTCRTTRWPSSPRSTWTRSSSLLGLDLDRAKMLAAVDPSLYRNRG